MQYLQAKTQMTNGEFMTVQNSQNRTETGQTTGQTNSLPIRSETVKSLPKDHADLPSEELLHGGLLEVALLGDELVQRVD